MMMITIANNTAFGGMFIFHRLFFAVERLDLDQAKCSSCINVTVELCPDNISRFQ